MRVLFATTANDGHFGPLQTLARAAERAGHQVRFAAPQSFRASVERAGFTLMPFADAPPELVGPVMGRLPTLSFAEADATVVREVFGRIDAQAALPGLLAATDGWRPHLVVREPAELGSLAAATRAGIPHIQLAIGVTEMLRTMRELVGEPLVELAELAGLPAESLIESAAVEPIFSSVPSELDQAGDDHYADGAVDFRFAEAGTDDHGARAAPTALADWGEPELPLVYVTFGTVTGSLPPFAGVFRQALDGLAEEPVRVLMTVGRRVDIDALGPLPANARVEPWWPQADVLGQAELVMSHGGFGTVMGAVRAGVPQVVAPIFTSDQDANARHLAAVGAGRAVRPDPDGIVEACRLVRTVLEDPGYRSAAAALATAAAGLPPVAEAVGQLERIAGA